MDNNILLMWFLDLPTKIRELNEFYSQWFLLHLPACLAVGIQSSKKESQTIQSKFLQTSVFLSIHSFFFFFLCLQISSFAYGLGSKSYGQEHNKKESCVSWPLVQKYAPHKLSWCQKLTIKYLLVLILMYFQSAKCLLLK